MNALEVKSAFTEADIVKVKVGQPTTTSFDAVSGSKISGTVQSIDVNATVSSNVVTYNAIISLIDPPSGLRPGMTASVAVTVDSRDNVLHVPTNAVTGTGTSGTVTVVQNGQATPTPVGVGLRGDDSVEITSGLTAGETVQLAGTTATASSTSSSRTSTSGQTRTFTGGGLGSGGFAPGGFGG